MEIAGFTFLRRADEVVIVTPLSPGKYAVTMPGQTGALYPAFGTLDPGVGVSAGGLYRFDVEARRPVRAAYCSAGDLHILDLQPRL